METSFLFRRYGGRGSLRQLALPRLNRPIRSPVGCAGHAMASDAHPTPSPALEDPEWLVASAPAGMHPFFLEFLTASPLPQP